jgi:phosphatidylethanolamine-binding protein (PEBP) family uncharacterized protein
MQNAKCKYQNAKCKMQNANIKMQISKCKIQKYTDEFLLFVIDPETNI